MTRWCAIATALLVLAAGAAHMAGAVPEAGAGARRAVAGRSTEPAPSDTALDRYLSTMSDSTEKYFGKTAARADTTGFDSTLAYGLAHPRAHERLRLARSISPYLGFSRVDGPVYGADAGIGRSHQLGRIEGLVQWAAGPNDWLGSGHYRKSWGDEEAGWSFQMYGGRRTDGMDPDYDDIQLAMVRAFFSGADYKNYLRRDGFETFLAREKPAWRLKAGYRDMLETPIATSATWNLTNSTPALIENLPAKRGRNHEFVLEAGGRAPRYPLRGEVEYASSSTSAGSDFEYRRVRVAGAADLAAGRRLAIVPQFSYGRLTGDAVPQASFYLGGTNSMRGILAAQRGGTGLALGRLDLIGADDVLQLMRLPHPAWLPIQAGAFAAAGAVWGTDPYGGPSRGGVDWPDAQNWISEAGAALLWRPGLPDPSGFFRFSYAWPLGPAREGSGFTASYSRALVLVKPLGE